MNAEVTIVSATYNRADALCRAIRCVRAQSFAQWRMLVIADACSDDTGERVAAFGDERIRFINLPRRFGEQAGPNSVGMALAETEFIAFLNHDDLWLPHHLADAVHTLRSTGTDFYWGAAAFFTNRGPRMDAAMFIERSPENRTLRDACGAPFRYSEPMSAWVLRRDAAARLGPMRLASETRKPPIVDYATRAWQANLSLGTGLEISVLKDSFRLLSVMGGQHRLAIPKVAGPPTTRYAIPIDFAEQWVRQIESGRQTDLLGVIHDDLWLASRLGLTRRFLPAIEAGLAHPGDVLTATGFDLVEWSAAASDKDIGLLGPILKNRTGESLGPQPDLPEMIAVARRMLEERP